jgi:hypothetical protein
MLNSQVNNFWNVLFIRNLTVEPLHGIDFSIKFIAKITVSFPAKWSIILHIVMG